MQSEADFYPTEKVKIEWRRGVVSIEAKNTNVTYVSRNQPPPTFGIIRYAS